jgi:succinyl-CoA synthetase alpha subunit
VFDRVAEAMSESGANASVIFVPRESAAAAIIEAVEAGIDLVVCITERIPVLDMIRVADALKGSQTRLIGPNTPGIITPRQCRIGIMPGEIFKPGSIGIISRSSTLTYEAIDQTTRVGLGQSTCVGVGGDPVHGMGFSECLELFRNDADTEAVVLIGEIGGSEEEQAAEYLQSIDYGKPVIACIVGEHVPDNTRMGHASAIIKNSSGTAVSKKQVLAEAGVHVVESPVSLGAEVDKILRS